LKKLHEQLGADYELIQRELACAKAEARQLKHECNASMDRSNRAELEMKKLLDQKAR